jgi:hypothetical protein
MDMREGFVFYRSFYDAICELDERTQLILFRAIVDYGLDGVLPDLEGVAKAIFLMAKPQIDANYRRYENGKKGGAPKGNQNARKNNLETTKNNLETTKEQPKINLEQPKEKEKVKDKEKDKDKEKVKVKDNPFELSPKEKIERTMKRLGYTT